ncbi:MAG: hypothetical protein P8171_25795 [Candidatus Thiodiazotropha sp.]
MRNIILVAVSMLLVACASDGIENKHKESLVFGDIRSDYFLTDRNDYGCKSIDTQVLEHILRTATPLTDEEVHDHYSTTGCSIDGVVAVNGTETSFVYDYGGIMWLRNGMILGCGKGCCSDSHEYCSFDKKGLQ